MWYGLDYICRNGVWKYNEQDYNLCIPNPAGGLENIKLEKTTVSRKTLGITDGPDKGYKDHLLSLQIKHKEWIERITFAKLPSHLAWVAYKHQLWPSLRYGIGTLSNTLEEGENTFKEIDYKLLPSLGICRNIGKEWRRLHPTFGGFGLVNFNTEQLIERVNLFMQHYGDNTILGKKLLCSLQLLQRGNP